MKMKGTFVFTAVVGLLVAYAYIFEFKKVDEEERQKSESAKFVKIKPEDIQGLAFETKEKFELVRTPGASPEWKISAPFADLADDTSVNAFLTSLVEEKSEEIAAEGAEIDFKMFGFTNPYRLTVKPKSGEPLLISIGTEQAMGGKRYLRLNQEPKVHIIGSGLWWQVDKGAQDFREKAILGKKEFADLRRMKMTVEKVGKTEVIDLKKVSDQWMLQGATELKGDNDTVDKFFHAVKNSRAVAFSAEDKNDAQSEKRFGLQKPARKVEFEFQDGTKWSMNVSASMDKKNYISVSDRSAVLEISESDSQGLQKSTDDFRNKNVPFSYDVSQVKSITAHVAATKFELKKEGDLWAMVAPDPQKNPTKEVSQETVRDLLSKLKELKASKFHGARKLLNPTPRGTITLADGQGKVLFNFKWSSGSPEKDHLVVGTSVIAEHMSVETSQVVALPYLNVIVDKSASTTPTTGASPSAPEPPVLPTDNHSHQHTETPPQ